MRNMFGGLLSIGLVILLCTVPGRPSASGETRDSEPMAATAATPYGAKSHIVQIDLDGSDGVNRVGVHFLDPSTGSYRLIYVNPWSGPIGEWQYPGADEDAHGFTAADVNGDGSADPILLTRNPQNGSMAVHVINGRNGKGLKRQPCFGPEWLPIDLAAFAPANGGGVHVAVLAQHGSTGEIAVQIREALSGAWIRNLFFLDALWTPMQLLVVDDFDGNPGPELGVLAVSQGGEIAIMLRDSGTNSFVSNLFYFGPGWDPVNAVSFFSRSGTGPAEVALLARSGSTGQLVTMIRDAASGAFLNNVFPYGGHTVLDPRELFVDGDWLGNGAADLGVVAQTEESGNYMCLIKDSMTGVVMTWGSCGQIYRWEQPLAGPTTWLDTIAWDRAGTPVESSLSYDSQYGARLKTCLRPTWKCTVISLPAP